MSKSIKFDRETKEFAAYLDGELVGFYRSYNEAEVDLNRIAYDLIASGYTSKAA